MGIPLFGRKAAFAPLRPVDYLKLLAIAGIVAVPLLVGIYAQGL